EGSNDASFALVKSPPNADRAPLAPESVMAPLPPFATGKGEFNIEIFPRPRFPLAADGFTTSPKLLALRRTLGAREPPLTEPFIRFELTAKKLVGFTRTLLVFTTTDSVCGARRDAGCACAGVSEIAAALRTISKEMNGRRLFMRIGDFDLI